MRVFEKSFCVLCALLLLGLSACGKTNPSSSSAPANETPAAAPAGNASAGNASAGNSSAAGNAVAPQAPAASKVLVAYFSCTGHTKKLAESVADALGADLYEITPATAYTTADLNYNDNQSRTTKEQNDASARPKITGSVSNMADYDVIFLGYPIWWGQAPRIICTFLESYDFSGKTIVPFCTSGSSGIGSSASDLHALCAKSAQWQDGARLKSDSSRADLVSWINGLGLGVTAK